MSLPEEDTNPASAENIRRRLAEATGVDPGGPPTTAFAAAALTWRRRASRAARWIAGAKPPAAPERDPLIQQGRLVMGRYSYHPPIVHTFTGDDTRVIVGSFCSLARGVAFVAGGNHAIDTVSSYPLKMILGLPDALEVGNPWSKGDIVVGNDVWIAREAKVVSGVTIGDGAVVGAFSVVTKDVEPYSIVMGSPAVHRRFRFEPEIVEALLRIAWWNWPDEVIRQRVEDITSRDVAGFVDKYDPSG